MPSRTLPALLLIVVLAAAVGVAAGRLIDDATWTPAVIGGIVGALIGLLATAFLARRGRRLRDGSEAQRISGLPLVAHVLPPGRNETERRRADEAFRMLRAALTFGGEDADVVVVSSAAPGEGKTTVAAGLARAIARAGRPVVVVEADLRRPGLVAALGLDATAGPKRGLTAAIVGGVAVDELLIEVEPGLHLLPAGELPPNAPELLGSDDAGRVLDTLVARGGTVILDTAPLLPVADTRELLGHEAPGQVILVARPGVVNRAELRDAVGLLPVGTPTILAVSGRAHTPRSYDRYLRDATPR
ncbi:MAG: CpsD/CapB family tyrosine-protein kinase [Patulibacter sp.]|nr:CpsD/CapB family tyrosine-protein kinase [Patulibacter sp.]